MSENKLFIKKIEYCEDFSSDKKNQTSAVFGLKLENLIATDIERFYQRQMAAEMAARQIDFINSLYNQSGNFAYEIRYISKIQDPVNGKKEEKGLDIVFLVKVKGDEAEKKAIDLSGFLPTILSSRLNTYEFRCISDQNELDEYLNPFEVNYLAEIRRRHRYISMSSMRREYRAGFFSNSAKEKSVLDDSIYYVFPFIPRNNDFSIFVRSLHEVPANLIYSCLLVPVSIEEKEIEFFNKQIAECENAIKQYSEINPTYSNRAYGLINSLENQLLRLLDAPYLMQIRIASNKPVDPVLMESIGVEITENQGINSNYYAGGYDVIFVDEEKRAEAIKKFQNLEPYLWANGAPEGFKRWIFMFDATEAQCAFRLPFPGQDEEVPGLKINFVKAIPLPGEIRLLVDQDIKKTKIGNYVWSGQIYPVYITDEDRLRHVYIVGQTGTGKTTLIKNMIINDLEKGAGLAVIDPHGDLFNDILGLIPKERLNDVVVLDPVDLEYPVGLNFLEWSSREEKYFLINEVKEIIRRMLEDDYGEYAGEMTGPLFYHFVEMGLLLIMSYPRQRDDEDRIATFYDFYELFQEKNNWKKWVPADYESQFDDPALISWVKNQLKDIDFTERQKDTGLNIGEYIVGKFKDFIFDPKLRAIFDQRKSTINIKEIMNAGKILLVNLAKGELSERCSRFLGMVLMARIMSAAMERVKIPAEKRHPFYIYVDEFQNIATATFSILLSEARKFRVGLVLANQFLHQITKRNILASIFGNVSTIIAFRVGLADADELDDVFLPTIKKEGLINLPNFQAAIRTSIMGKICSPFYFRTEPSKVPDQNIRELVRMSSREKYGKSPVKRNLNILDGKFEKKKITIVEDENPYT